MQSNQYEVESSFTAMLTATLQDIDEISMHLVS